MTDNMQMLSLENRQTLRLSGVIEIIGFTDELITLYTNMGDLRIRGENLEVNKAFTEKGNIEINGYVKSLSYSNNKEKYADNFISRIFR